MHNKYSFVYILSSCKNGALYIGITNNLKRRMYEHKQQKIAGFTKKYEIHHLVYYEVFENIESAISREKQLKKWNRIWKIRLITEMNSTWKDLYYEI
ncbi:GIY-YIG nuclease family protein [Candidatus Roizmanbacteria bacterium]|nr:GIY-YIG nuclease family protein [Candidatus Roizmanbacteria bacterium]